MATLNGRKPKAAKKQTEPTPFNKQRMEVLLLVVQLPLLARVQQMAWP